MFKKNTAVVGFHIGTFINASTGAEVKTGTPVCTRNLDGTAASMANAAAFNATLDGWEIDLETADTNGDMVAYHFALTDCLPIDYQFRTTTKLVGDLQDLAAGAEMDIVDAPNATAVTALQSGLATATGVSAVQTHGDSTWATATGFSTHSAADVWDVSVRSLSTFGSLVSDVVSAVWAAVVDSAGITTLLGRLTAPRAGYLDELGPTNLPADVDTIAVDVAGLDGEAMRGTDSASTLDAAGVRGAVGLAAANLDTQLAAIVEDTGTTLPATLSALATAAGLAAHDGKLDTVDGIVDALLVIANRLDDTLEDDGGTYRFTTNALEQAPSGTGGDATAENQTAILASLTAAKGATFDTSTDSLEAIRDRGDAAWTGTVTDGDVPVTHATLDDDGAALLPTDHLGNPLGGVTVRAYRRAEYDAGNLSVVRASAVSDDDGHFLLYLGDGVEYTLTFTYGAQVLTQEVTP